jgi:hypothetical protein
MIRRKRGCRTADEKVGRSDGSFSLSGIWNSAVGEFAEKSAQKTEFRCNPILRHCYEIAFSSQSKCVLVLSHCILL